MNWYYKIWVDCILKAKSLPKNEKDWPFFTMVFMSMCMALNLWLAMFILMIHFDIALPFFPLKVNIFPGQKIDAFVSFFISYLLPMLLINYFLIFNNGRYKKLLTRYKYHNGKLFISYFLGSILILIVYLIIAFIITKIL